MISVLSVAVVSVVSLGVFAQEESAVGEAVEEGMPVEVGCLPTDPLVEEEATPDGGSGVLGVGGYASQSILLL